MRDPSSFRLLTPPPRAVHIIANPTAGSAGRLAEAQRLFAAAGLSVSLAETQSAGHAERLAADAQRHCDDATAIVAAGGDGTIQDVVNGLLRSGRPGDRPVRLGVLPLGTANVLAWELGVGRLRPAVAAIARGRLRAVSVPRCEERYFLQMAGVGFDARVVAGVSSPFKRRFGKLAYALRSAEEWARRRPPSLRVVVDGESHEAASVILANGRYYGGRFVACPGARLEDRALELRLFLAQGRAYTLLYALALLWGMGRWVPATRLLRGERIRIEPLAGCDPDEPVQADGELIAALPATITAWAAEIELYAP